ncbi:MAG TPA: hypothetical protein VKK79_21400 [Candidatus Lokiarchaeia archaeon]|nr:hypothetical protein [Candidatus Lokiarchaeia archaeon]
MQIKDYFTFTEKIVADYLGGEPAAENLWYEEILYRTAINRLDFGIFLLVAERFHLQFLTAEQKQRCHSVIRKQARSSTNPKFANSYESLEALR